MRAVGGKRKKGSRSILLCVYRPELQKGVESRRRRQLNKMTAAAAAHPGIDIVTRQYLVNLKRKLQLLQCAVLTHTHLQNRLNKTKIDWGGFKVPSNRFVCFCLNN